MHPLLKQALVGLGRAGIKAGVAALDSALEDAEKLAGEAGARVKRARGRARKLVQEEEEEES